MSASPKTLRPAARRRRNREIAAARSAGETWPSIAKRFGLSERQARRAAEAAQQLQAEVLNIADAEELIVDVVQVQRRALDLLGAMLKSDLDNDAARIGAVRTAGTLGLDIHQTLIKSGLLPATAAEFHYTREIRAAVEALFEVCNDLGISPKDVERRLEDRPQLGIGSTSVGDGVAA
jgi:hypothetical protein